MNQPDDTMVNIFIPMEDELVHTTSKPFCWDSTCQCHENIENIGVVNQHVVEGLMTPEEASRYVNGQMV